MEREKAVAAAATKGKAAKDKGGKKGKSRSPSPKKGGKKDTDSMATPTPCKLYLRYPLDDTDGMNIVYHHIYI